MTLSIMTDLRPGPAVDDWARHYAEYLTEVRLADTLGYRGLRVPESHGHDDGMMPAPFVALAAAAAATTRLRLMTYIVPLALHSARAVVEPAAVVDLLSGGRLELGVGAGGASDQFEAIGVDPKQRGRLAEARMVEMRQGFDTGTLPDGHGGAPIAVSPPPSGRVPIYYGGLTEKAIDRAVRLSDGCLPYDYVCPDEKIPTIYEQILAPALARHGRTLEDFFFGIGLVLWVCDDPDRDWDTIVSPALAYRQRKYLEWAKGDRGGLQGMTEEALRDGVLIGTAEQVAERLRAMQARAPFTDIAFWYRLPGVGHDDAMSHLERVTSQLLPLLDQE